MAIIDNFELDGLIGSWDDVELKWVSPPAKIEELPEKATISRNSIVMTFIGADAAAELDAWMAGSKIVQSYFATEELTADYTGLTTILAMIQDAIDNTVINSVVGQALLDMVTEVRNGVKIQ